MIPAECAASSPSAICVLQSSSDSISSGRPAMWCLSCLLYTSYMSPEQVRGGDLDKRTDLFSLGSVLYEMGTGAMAFSGGTSGVIFEAILNRPPVSPLRLNPALPAGFEQVVNKALELSLIHI